MGNGRQLKMWSSRIKSYNLFKRKGYQQTKIGKGMGISRQRLRKFLKVILYVRIGSLYSMYRNHCVLALILYCLVVWFKSVLSFLIQKIKGQTELEFLRLMRLFEESPEVVLWHGYELNCAPSPKMVLTRVSFDAVAYSFNK